MNIYDRLSQKASEIEREMQRIGFWSKENIKIDPKECTEAFCADKLSFEQWLQFIFIPNIRKIIFEKGDLPKDSQLGVKAGKEFDYVSSKPEIDKLITILQSIDQIIKNQDK